MDHELTAEERLALLEKKIDYIIKILGIKAFEKENTESGEPPPIPVRAQPKITSEPFQDHLKPSSHVVQKNSSENFLPILSVICFFLAAIFLVKLSIDSGWMTLEKQWGLLTLFGVALASFSLLIKKIDLNYRSYLGGAGAVILYIAAYSSYIYFGLFNSLTAFALGGLVSFFSFYLLHYFKLELFVIITCVGTYISPVVLGKDSDFIYLSAFFLIWAGVFSRMAVYFNTRVLTLLGSYLGLGIFIALNLESVSRENALDVILVQTMQFMIYCGGVLYFSMKNNKALTFRESIAYLPILMFFYGTTYYLLNLYDPKIAPWIALAFAGFVYLLYLKGKHDLKNLESQVMVQSFLSVVIFHAGYVELLPAIGKPWLLPLIMLGLYISENYKQYKIVGLPIKALFFIIALIEFLGICWRLLVEINLYNILPSMATILLGFFYYLRGSKKINDQEGLFLALLHIISIITLYRLVYDYGSLAVSGAWVAYSMAILGVGYFQRNPILAKSSLLVLMVACTKALVYDASQSASPVRVGSLLLTGVVLYGAGYMFKIIKAWKK